VIPPLVRSCMFTVFSCATAR